VRTLSKNGFLEGSLNDIFGKVCKWMRKCLGCIDVAFWTITMEDNPRQNILLNQPPPQEIH
jgi:hypothetical protein